MADIKFNLETITMVTELAKLGMGFVMNHRRANNKPLDEPVTVDEILALRIQSADQLIDQGLRGDS